MKEKKYILKDRIEEINSMDIDNAEKLKLVLQSVLEVKPKNADETAQINAILDVVKKGMDRIEKVSTLFVEAE